MIARAQITGLVLAGGQGRRMGGVDKGLLPFRGTPLARHTLQRLAPQVASTALSANRHLADYQGFGVPVWPDSVGGFAGPLAGMLAGLEQARTPWLATVPCDTPLFPEDLVPRLGGALAARPQARLAMATAPDTEGRPQRQSVFCLLHASLCQSLRDFLARGGHKVGQWADEQAVLLVPFDSASAFANANTPQDLQALERDAG